MLNIIVGCCIGILLLFSLIWLISILLIIKFNKQKLIILTQQNLDIQEQLALAQNEINNKQDIILNLKLDNTRLQTKLASELSNLEQQRVELEKVKQQLSHEFTSLSSKIFNDASTQNKLNLADILNPLAEKIKDFERKVDNVYREEGQERATLKEQIKNLMSLNQVMSTQTHNLTTALKTNYKTQGSWGEMVLENLLNLAGLIQGREYIIQNSQYSEDGRLFRPDVIVNLPDNRIFVIDSKVSLNAYERYYSATSDSDKEQALKEHIKAVNNHIVALSNKNYTKLYQNQSLDFVLMFLPIESAFALALSHNQDLFNNAFKHNIILVSPTTLLATMRTVAHIWRTEKYINSATEIANEGGRIIDKLNVFLDVMTALDRALIQARNKYDEARSKLTNQQGVINIAKKLQTLGVKAQKDIAPSWQPNEQE